MNEPMKPAPPVTSTREPSSSMLMIHPCVCARSALGGPARTDPPGSGWETVVHLSRDTTQQHGVTGHAGHVLVKGLILADSRPTGTRPSSAVARAWQTAR